LREIFEEFLWVRKVPDRELEEQLEFFGPRRKKVL
jgi:hypothetical protein